MANQSVVKLRLRIGNKGQGMIETGAIFIILVLLFGAIINIWLWSNKQIVDRQIKFNDTRVQAGTSAEDYELVWPVHKAENLKEDQVILTPP